MNPKNGGAGDMKDMKIPIIVGNEYTRKDIRKIFNIPGDRGGNFDTGYSKYNDQYFVFATIVSPGRTGHDYANKLTGYELEWYSKNNHNLNSNAVQELVKAESNRYIFTRNNTNEPFTYQGHGIAKKLFDQKPVKIIWDFSLDHEIDQNLFPEEINLGVECLNEGAKKQVTVNI